MGSLFSGVGGIDIGLEAAGWTVAWQCESAPYPRHVLAQHWPSVPCYPDVTTLRTDAGKEGWPELAGVDLIAGGFP